MKKNKIKVIKEAMWWIGIGIVIGGAVIKSTLAAIIIFFFLLLIGGIIEGMEN